MKSALSKLLFTLVAFVALAVIIPSAARAQGQSGCTVMPEPYCSIITGLMQGQKPGPWYNQSLTQFSSKVFGGTPDNEIFGERYTFAQVNWIINSIFTMFLPDASRIDSIEGLFLLMQAVNQTPTQPPSSELMRRVGLAGLSPAVITHTLTHPPADRKSVV